MNNLRIICLVAALSLAVSTAHADPLPDPKILVMGTGYSEVLYGPHWSFTANATGGGIFDFVNASGNDWVGVDLTTPTPYGLIDGQWSPLDSPEFYELGSDLFAETSLSFGEDDLTMRFFGVDGEHPGIPSTELHALGYPPDYGSHFSCLLDNDGTPDIGGWLGPDHEPLTFNAAARPVPEPGTFVLVMSGLALVGLAARKRR